MPWQLEPRIHTLASPDQPVSEAWIGVIGVGIGVVLNEILGMWRARRVFALEKRWSVFETARSKLEHLYELCEQQRESYRHAHATLFDALVTGGAVGDLRSFPAVPWSRLAMLVTIYAPALTPDTNRLQAAGDRFGTEFAAIRSHPREATDASDLVAEYQLLFDAYEEYMRKLPSMQLPYNATP